MAECSYESQNDPKCLRRKRLYIQIVEYCKYRSRRRDERRASGGNFSGSRGQAGARPLARSTACPRLGLVPATRAICMYSMSLLYISCRISRPIQQGGRCTGLPVPSGRFGDPTAEQRFETAIRPCGHATRGKVRRSLSAHETAHPPGAGIAQKSHRDVTLRAQRRRTPGTRDRQAHQRVVPSGSHRKGECERRSAVPMRHCPHVEVQCEEFRHRPIPAHQPVLPSGHRQSGRGVNYESRLQERNTAGIGAPPKQQRRNRRRRRLLRLLNCQPVAERSREMIAADPARRAVGHEILAAGGNQLLGAGIVSPGADRPVSVGVATVHEFGFPAGGMEQAHVVTEFVSYRRDDGKHHGRPATSGIGHSRGSGCISA